MNTNISIGLKEWASVCDALGSGRQIILLRKGGILEAKKGFTVEHPRFVLFPTYLHQNLQMLKPEAHEGFQVHSSEPEMIHIECAAEVSDIVRLTCRAQMDSIDDEHIWTPPLIDMRFNYKPANPLYLLLVRVFRLAAPADIANTPQYAGCKSWVPLTQEFKTADAAPVMDEEEFLSRRMSILTRVEGAGAGDK